MDCLESAFEPCSAGPACLFSQIAEGDDEQWPYPCVPHSKHGCGHCVTCYYMCPCDTAEAARCYKFPKWRTERRSSSRMEPLHLQPSHGVSELWADRQQRRKRRRCTWRRQSTGLSVRIFTPAKQDDLGGMHPVGQVELRRRPDGSWERHQLGPPGHADTA